MSKVWIDQAQRSLRLVAVAAALLGVSLLPATFARAGVVNDGNVKLTLTGGIISIKNGGTVFDLNPCDPEVEECEIEASAPVTLRGTVAADGALNIPANGVFFPSVHIDDPSPVDVGIAATSAVTGVLDPHTGQFTATVNLAIYIAPTGVSAVCIINLPMVLSSSNPGGVPYDQNTGSAKGTNTTFAVANATSAGGVIGAIACPQVSTGFGLPAAAGTNVVEMEFSVQPIVKGLVADAGADQSMLYANEPVVLDGSGSTDAEDEAITYQWTQLSGPPVVLDDPNSATPSFMPVGELTNYAFELTVINESGLVDTDLTAAGVYLNLADGQANGQKVLNKDRCELGLGGVWTNQQGQKSCTFVHTIVESAVVTVNEGIIFVNESQLPDGPRSSPQYRGNVQVLLHHDVQTTYWVANTTSGQGHAELDGPWYSNIVDQESVILDTTVEATVLSCQRRTLGILGWSTFSNRTFTECSARDTFTYPHILQGVEFELP
jgi:hypothetical protein